MKLKFIIEKGFNSELPTPIDKIDISKFDYYVTIGHDPKKIISKGIVSKETGFLWCEAEISEKYHHLTGSIGYKKRGNRFELIEIGLVEKENNLDPTINPIGQPQL